MSALRKLSLGVKLLARRPPSLDHLMEAKVKK